MVNVASWLPLIAAVAYLVYVLASGNQPAQIAPAINSVIVAWGVLHGVKAAHARLDQFIYS